MVGISKLAPTCHVGCFSFLSSFSNKTLWGHLHVVRSLELVGNLIFPATHDEFNEQKCHCYLLIICSQAQTLDSNCIYMILWPCT